MNAPATPGDVPPNAVAVIGMAARLPGANSVSAFWDNLRRGEESIVTLSEEELLAAGISEQTLANPFYIRRAPIVDGIDEFDNDFFGFPPQMARMMDPQHRLFLQTAWHAMEDAGCDPAGFDGSIGVYATSGSSIYLLHNLLTHHDPNTILGQGATFDLVNMSLLNDKDYLATRVSHQFNLRGPSVTVQTACSSSMVAIHTACQSLLNGESDIVLAGGVSLRVPHHVGYFHEPGSMVSGVGHCRPFDSRADGTVFGSGVAVVVLKPLATALEDGDRIHAVIRGSAINNDGSMKMTYAAPNGAAQADVIAEAHAVADVDPATISYVEAHGTGTPLGDPIEIDGLRRAFGVSDTPRPGPCAVGSVKSNIGHLAEVSGIAGLIKTILSLQHKAIPATLHYTEPNPALDLDRGPFVIQSEYTPWEWDGIRRAGVSSFGVGGTNVHLVVEEAPTRPVTAPLDGPKVLRLSARTEESLSALRTALADELADNDALDLDDVAFTLAGRRTDQVRMAAVVHDRADAAAVLRSPDSDDVFVGEGVDARDESDRVVFLFPGQGAQHADMARGLYDREPVFAAAFDECAAGFDAELGIDLKASVFGPTTPELERTDLAQSSLFTVEYALGRLIESYGVTAGAYAGHSIGEYAAAALAGVFDLPTAVKVVAQRARLMHASPSGAMVAVGAGLEDIGDLLTADLDVAAINELGGCVISGSQEDVKTLQNELRRRRILARRVRTSHAFHSRLMDAVVPQFAEFLSGVKLNAPRIPLLSNVTGTWMTDAEATDPQFWARQIRATVRFADELSTVLATPHRVLVEVGPGGTLTGAAVRHPRWSEDHRAVRLMRHQVQTRDDHDTFLLALGQMWAAGVDLDWSRLSKDKPGLITLPGYQFARHRHWVEPNRNLEWSQGVPSTDASRPVSEPAAAVAASTSGQSIEQRLQQIWCECLGVASIDPAENFFEIGGDSLIAIGVAMNATNKGLDLTPQDLYEYPTVSALAGALGARFSTGGLAEMPAADAINPPVPPAVAHFLEYGIQDAGRWRVPLLFAIRPEVGVDDVRAVLTAVTNHHDALRVRIDARAGSWEQRITPAVEAVDPEILTLPAGTGHGTAREREAVLDLIADHLSADDLSVSPLRAAYILDADGTARFLALSVHEMVVDSTSREILLTDIITAFGQRLAGQEVSLPPATTSWQAWSQRCAELTTHPAVLAGREYWVETATKTTMHIADRHVTDPPRSEHLVRMGTTLPAGQTEEVDRARRMYQYTLDELLLAALSRTVGDTLGDGVLAVGVCGDARPVLKPELDPRRTVGAFATLYPLALACAGTQATPAVEVLNAVHNTLDGVPHHGIGYGLLRFLYGPTARTLSPVPPPDILLCNEGVVPEVDLGDSPIQLDADVASSLRDKIPGLGHPIELRVFRSSGELHLDWWYDTRRVPQETVEVFAARFPAALNDLVAESSASAGANAELADAIEELALVDLSAE
ncbi:type I polyketide synthase [Mycolicibacterium monacense]|uniref:Phthiocerol/phenolphthiocerol synthesis polyketide synthase type I PpsE n=3 Tax=Mycobacteriaceae TaxID=1762 RepID=A0AAD1MZ66_MYCMB|nr:type I polyketide synthase [Mycolicibacterium monacense]MDA4101734.1 polyketide synthase [Mycolicibacterium monacense DSM 44395]OBF47220.1 polyketide synthase [Mycolicibacterium monacense]ORB13761.1 polyketide synthase [Mycolicibacterium monacense DSM 44395]QHP86556.1 acyltransferase domain-containing protein [Mycolicibacterium monacense DSM 44395]BBZ60396.1 phthiocerol/phenolphthiocerol synthesis polyketide synthase type I PpsE [Mycolicibacterium monacense]